MSWIEANPELVTAILASMVLLTEMLRRVMRRVSRQRAVSLAALKTRRSLGFLEVLLVCLVLAASIQLAVHSGLGPDGLKLLPGEWIASLKRSHANSETQRETPVAYRSLESARVTKVKDGDSLVMRLSDGESVEARLHGIDAPEYRQPHGGAAKRALSRKVSLRRVGFEEVTIDSYGRRVVVLYRGDRKINSEMVCEGHAWWYRRYARRARDLEQCEEAARAERIGLWRADDPVPPWDWRRRQ